MSDVAMASGAQTAPVERGSFTGSGKEYFPIWIVNILLTIVTIGIYSAWAKVRRKRYFYGNTVLAGHSFEYHAKGKQIFLGRLIAIGLIIVVNIASALNPIFGLIGTLIFLLLLPMFVVRSLRFNARVTSYRNVRFDFVGKTGGAFVAVLLGSLVAILSLGLLAPFASRWLYRYVFNNLRYGDRPFATDPGIGKLYKSLILPALMMVVGLVLVSITAAAAIALTSQGFPMDDDARAYAAVAAIYIGMFGFFIILAIAGIFYRIAVRNVVWNATTLDGRHRLMSDMGRFRYFWIVISNLVVTVFTFGLMRPWAAVREARYIAEHSGIAFEGDLGEVFSSIQASGSAISAEYLDMEGFDFGF